MNLADIINPDLPVPGELTKWGYRYMSEAEYRSFPAINNSLLKCSTLAEMWAALNAPQPQSEALALGTVADLAILTPQAPWAERFALADIPINARTGEAYGKDTKKAKDAWKEAERLNPGKFILSQDSMQALTADLKELTAAFWRNPLCAAALDGALLQVSGVMWHPQWQCWVKWKPDALPAKPDPKHGWVISDLKTTRRHILQFERDCWEYDYFGQAGWYAHCHEMLMRSRGMAIRVSNFDFLAVAKPDLEGKRPRPAMARRFRVPLDPVLNAHMEPFNVRVFPKDGMGRVEMFLAAVREHIAAKPDITDPEAVARIWTAYEHESEPHILCRLPRA